MFRCRGPSYCTSASQVTISRYRYVSILKLWGRIERKYYSIDNSKCCKARALTLQQQQHQPLFCMLWSGQRAVQCRITHLIPFAQPERAFGERMEILKNAPLQWLPTTIKNVVAWLGAPASTTLTGRSWEFVGIYIDIYYIELCSIGAIGVGLLMHSQILL